MRVARMIRKLRLAKGWSQEQLAEFSGLSVRTVQRLEKGDKPSLESLKALASVFEVDINDLTPEDTDNASEQVVDNNTAIADDINGFYLNLIVFAIIVPILFVLNHFLTPGYYWAFWVLGGWSLATLLYAIIEFDGVGWLQGMFARKH